MINGSDFYEKNLEKQREIVDKKIQEAIDTGDPQILLPFDVYPILAKEMENSGWTCSICVDNNTGKNYSILAPNEYYN